MKKTPRLFLWVIALAVIVAGCAEDDRFGSPYDPENPLTSGAPTDLRVAPGDESATLSWFALGVSGVSSYRVYRQNEPGAPFERVGEIAAVTDGDTGREPIGHRYVFTDDGDLENDRVDFRGSPVPYTYRVTIVDKNGVETPDPSSPPSLEDADPRYWRAVSISPSLAPPIPPVEVTVSDLAVQLDWSGYEPPGDAVAYRIYGALVGNDPNPPLLLIQEITISGSIVGNIGDPGTSQRTLFVDRSFLRDLITKEYRVAVIDKFGVETADTPETRRRATVPNLPPAPVDFAVTDIVPGASGLPQVVIEWTPAREEDVVGYNIYATANTPRGWELRQTVRGKSQKSAMIPENSLILPEYFVTAFDSTNRDDGNFDQVYPPGWFQ